MNYPTEAASPPPSPRVRLPLVKPFWTYAIIGFTAFVYLLQLLLGDAFTYAYGLKVNELIRLGQYWRLITPIFFHANTPLHILFNMYALYAFGPELERFFGHLRFLLVYFIAGYAGVLASFALSPDYSLGASGAIFGVIGAFAYFLYRNQHFLGAIGRNRLYNVLFIIGLNVFLSFSEGIDLWAHFGGLLAGTAIAWLTGPVWAAELEPYTGAPRIVDQQNLTKRWPVLLALLAGLLVLSLWLVR
jgi:rhomboid protease GluP